MAITPVPSSGCVKRPEIVKSRQASNEVLIRFPFGPGEYYSICVNEQQGWVRYRRLVEQPIVEPAPAPLPQQETENLNTLIRRDK